MKNQFTALNAALADTSTAELIHRIETSSVFQCRELEDELNARLERLGKRWRFATPTTIETYIPDRSRRPQQGCSIGLFDTDARAQSDIADL